MTAALLWGSQPDRVQLNGRGGPGLFEISTRCQIGVAYHVEIVVTGAVIGGRRNSEIAEHQGRWLLRHMGHVQPILVDGERFHGLDCPVAHGTVIEPVAVGPHSPRFVLSTAHPGEPLTPRRAGQAVLWWLPPRRGVTLAGSTDEGMRALEPGRPFLLAPLSRADLPIGNAPCAPLLRIRHTDRWWLDHLDHGPAVTVAGVTLRNASYPLASGDAIEYLDALSLVFER